MKRNDSLAVYFFVHIGWKMPNCDSSDYGWGPNSYWAAYFANGKPQGLREYKNEATEEFLHQQRDWLFGRNPWSTSMFTGIPEDGEYPLDVNTSVWALTHKEVTGGLARSGRHSGNPTPEG